MASTTHKQGSQLGCGVARCSAWRSSASMGITDHGKQVQGLKTLWPGKMASLLTILTTNKKAHFEISGTSDSCMASACLRDPRATFKGVQTVSTEGLTHPPQDSLKDGVKHWAGRHL